MLAAFYGSDRNKVNEAAKKRLHAFLKENPGAETFALGDENFSEGELEKHTGSVGLFTGAHAVVLSHLLNHDEHGEILADHLKALKESENLFILKEGELNAKSVKLVDPPSLKLRKGEENTHEVARFDLKETSAKKSFPIFDLANHLGNRDKKALWLGYQAALKEGIAPEEVHSILMWQARTMLHVSAGAVEGIKPFVVTKARGYLRHYPGDDARKLSMDLLSLYHDARRGLVDFELGLEKFILGL